MDTYSFNFYYIFKFILLLLAIFGGYSLIKDVISAIARGFADKLNNETIQKLTNKDIKLIVSENAQEIHEINKNLEDFNKRISLIEWNYKEIIKNAHNSN